MLRTLALTLALATPSAAFEFEALEGGVHDLDAWRGRAVLVVNTASLCAFTDQYAGLQTLQDRYGDRGLTVLAVPSDSFAQELEDEDAVAEFCEVSYGLTLPMTTITPVTGPDAHPFYGWLAEQGAVPRWNFSKALLDPEGTLVTFEGSHVAPLGRRMIRAIEAVLPE
ncbi:glutathione peroxidase [Jannaschia sp. M317]|uniref:glutathione peroxidase n=1 Tax=Jannaschia sp. M317 TaxID=2867011 RepID=UPI0021A526A3|nr:glutathione peroxidase [Jannaschia sp. M317]UWQ16450.1 glutathione peroxidase [Jannaschia sp. M317]